MPRATYWYWGSQGRLILSTRYTPGAVFGSWTPLVLDISGPTSGGATTDVRTPSVRPRLKRWCVVYPPAVSFTLLHSRLSVAVNPLTFIAKHITMQASLSASLVAAPSRTVRRHIARNAERLRSALLSKPRRPLRSITVHATAAKQVRRVKLVFTSMVFRLCA